MVKKTQRKIEVTLGLVHLNTAQKNERELKGKESEQCKSLLNTEKVQKKAKPGKYCMINRFTKPINYTSTILFQLKQDIKQLLEYLCDGSKLLWQQKQFEKTDHEITAYSTKDNAVWREQVIVSAQKGHSLGTEQGKYTGKRNVLLELPEILSAITIKCAAQTAAKVTNVSLTEI